MTTQEVGHTSEATAAIDNARTAAVWTTEGGYPIYSGNDLVLRFHPEPGEKLSPVLNSLGYPMGWNS